MSNNFKDKNITAEQENIKQNLKKLDRYLIIPDSIKPENINYKRKKKNNFLKPIVAAACLVLIISSVFLFNMNNTLISNNYDEIKNVYLSLNKLESNGITEEQNLFRKEDLALSVQDSAGGSVSNTNIQVEGVDEGDIVKTDGNYIYSINEYSYIDNVDGVDFYKNNMTINIISTLRMGEIKKQSSINAVGRPIEMYIQDKSLVVITQLDPQYLDLETNEILTEDEYYKKSEEFYESHENAEEEIYKLFNNRYQFQNRTAAIIYDITDATNPKLVREFAQEGYYSSSRLVDNDLYLVTTKNDYPIVYDKEEDIKPENIVPYTTDSIDGGDKNTIKSKNISIIDNPNSYSFIVISGLNITSNEEATTKACLGGSNIIYSSLNSIYVTSPKYSNEPGANNRATMDMTLPLNSDTNIVKFTLEDGKPSYKAAGLIPGRILNQYSMDEYNGYFRIATTEGNPWGDSSENISKNNIYILDDNLNIVGKIEDLAPGERIYSVRFMGEKGYVVTFKQVDPLFALDLSNPQDPKVTGELKIPGFSSYLHPYSENLLIGIGYDTENKIVDGVEVVEQKGLKLSLFDVTNPLEPKEIQSFILGTQGTYSEVLNNPKALLFSKEKDILAFPVSLFEDTETSEESYIGYYIFSVDEASGFSLKGRVTHYEKPINNNYTDEKDHLDNLGFDVNRGIYVDDVLYTISGKLLQANSLNDFSLISKVDLR